MKSPFAGRDDDRREVPDGRRGDRDGQGEDDEEGGNAGRVRATRSLFMGYGCSFRATVDAIRMISLQGQGGRRVGRCTGSRR